MSFETLMPPPKAAKASDPVRIALRTPPNGLPRLSLIVKAEVLDRLDPKKRSFDIALGSAEDRHLLRMSAASEGLFHAYEVKARGNGGTFRVVLPPHERWPRCRFKPQAAKYEVRENALFVTLPFWAWDPRAKDAAEKLARVQDDADDE